LNALHEAWRDAWEGQESARALIAARFILCAHALWIFASRPDLPGLFSWPAAFWDPVSPFLQWRFLILGRSLFWEWLLYAVLWVALAAGAAGLWPRAACFAAALLTYHFASLEDVLNAGGSNYFRGLTTTILALFVLSFGATPRWNAAPSP
jgi:hypothetical protein